LREKWEKSLSALSVFLLGRFFMRHFLSFFLSPFTNNSEIANKPIQWTVDIYARCFAHHTNNSDLRSNLRKLMKCSWKHTWGRDGSYGRQRHLAILRVNEVWMKVYMKPRRVVRTESVAGHSYEYRHHHKHNMTRREISSFAYSPCCLCIRFF